MAPGAAAGRVTDGPVVSALTRAKTGIFYLSCTLDRIVIESGASTEERMLGYLDQRVLAEIGHLIAASVSDGRVYVVQMYARERVDDGANPRLEQWQRPYSILLADPAQAEIGEYVAIPSVAELMGQGYGDRYADAIQRDLHPKYDGKLWVNYKFAWQRIFDHAPVSGETNRE